MAERLTLSEAADLLGIRPRTLYAWLQKQEEDAGKPAQASEDGRAKTLTRKQVEALAKAHHKMLAPRDRIIGIENNLRELDKKVEALARRVDDLEGKQKPTRQFRAPTPDT